MVSDRSRARLVDGGGRLLNVYSILRVVVINGLREPGLRVRSCCTTWVWARVSRADRSEKRRREEKERINNSKSAPTGSIDEGYPRTTQRYVYTQGITRMKYVIHEKGSADNSAFPYNYRPSRWDPARDTPGVAHACKVQALTEQRERRKRPAGGQFVDAKFKSPWSMCARKQKGR